ncbi:DUF4833 domain-containing protein [Pedobacter nanyangensis]|uniref:DUF4833 domain-containing protein n=1 Tax=Pedobacter nanyangensis TaxID=1562389 RepID=UPI000DE1F730|nr:DUF4833 domain-containing protein [Pedobacter nanyangensis]
MKFIILLTLSAIVYHIGYAQENYPVPERSDSRLFYIQHSDNHNTYVYDAHIINKNISDKNPVEVYRILYEEKGQKLPLTKIQQKLAYGIDFKRKDMNSFELNLVSFKKLKFSLALEQQKPVVYTTVNNREMYLDKIFIHIKEGKGLNVKPDYVILTGRDYATKKAVEERYYLSNQLAHRNNHK